MNALADAWLQKHGWELSSSTSQRIDAVLPAHEGLDDAWLLTYDIIESHKDVELTRILKDELNSAARSVAQQSGCLWFRPTQDDCSYFATENGTALPQLLRALLRAGEQLGFCLRVATVHTVEVDERVRVYGGNVMSAERLFTLAARMRDARATWRRDDGDAPRSGAEHKIRLSPCVVALPDEEAPLRPAWRWASQDEPIIRHEQWDGPGDRRFVEILCPAGAELPVRPYAQPRDASESASELPAWGDGID